MIINISFIYYKEIKLLFLNIKINIYYLITSIIIKNKFIIN